MIRSARCVRRIRLAGSVGGVALVVLFLGLLVEAPGSVLVTRLGPTLGARLGLGIDGSARGGPLGSTRFFEAAMATLFHVVPPGWNGF
jgi:hypothetical protein